MAATDLRARRRAETRAEIGAVARDLFAERGFDAVTIAEIAGAAGVGERTFYRYFPTKEHAALEHLTGFIDHGVALIEARPATEQPLASIRAAIDELSRHGYEATLALDALLVETVASVAGLQHHLVMAAQDRLAAHFAARAGAPPNDLRSRLDAVACTAAYQAATRTWMAAAAGGDDPGDVWAIARAAVDQLAIGLGPDLAPELVPGEEGP